MDWVRWLCWTCLTVLGGLIVGGCASSPEGAPSSSASRSDSSRADFSRLSCAQMADESDQLQRRAVAVAYAVGNYTGPGVLALGSGLSLYWPAVLATRTSGMEARDLQSLKARFDALQAAAAAQRCSPVPAQDTSPAAASTNTPLTGAVKDAVTRARPGDRYDYEDRRNMRSAAREWSLVAQQVNGQQTTYTGSDLALPGGGANWVLDTAGNVAAAPDGSLWWPQLLRAALTLGQVTAGDIMLAGDPLARARMRGQIVAVGQQTVAGWRFDAAVVELFGDAPSGDAYTRVEGVIVVDRATGTLLRLDLRSAHPAFNLQRRLLRWVPAQP